MEKRVFLTIAICFGILFAWNTIMPKLVPSWFPKPKKAMIVEGPADAGTTEGTPGFTATGPDGDAVPDGDPSGENPAVEANLPPARAETFATLESESVRAVFTSKGASLARWELLADQFAVETDDGKSGPLDLLAGPEPPATRPFSTTFEGLEWTADVDYELVESTRMKAVFRASAGGVTLTKTFTLDPERYLVSLALEVENTGAAPIEFTPTMSLQKRMPEDDGGRGFLSFLTRPMPNITLPKCAHEGEVEDFAHDDDVPQFVHTGTLDWVGIDSRYFLSAIFEGKPGESSASGTCTLENDKKLLTARLAGTPLVVRPGGRAQASYTGHFGPKFKAQLEENGHGLNRSIDFGFFGVLSLLLLAVMNFFQGLVGNWGLAIIALTITVKLVLFPLTQWSMKSMEKMRTLGPKMKELKEKFGKDAQKYQAEIMKLYKSEGVNPVGGCIPMLLQLPIWIALYRTILNTAELYNATFIGGWLENLAEPEVGVIKVLPLMMGVTMFLMQKMQPVAAAADDKQAQMQKTMMYFMPPFFTFIMYSLPTGLTLYIFVNNLLSIAQQYYIRQTLKKQSEATAVPA